LRRKLVGTLSALALLAAAAASPARAQQATIAGTVTAEATGRPVPGVRVTAEGTRAAAQTDSAGRYTLTGLSGGTYTLTAQSAGYAAASRGDVRLAAGTSATVDFRLRPSVLEIEGLVVTGVTAPTAGTKVPFAVGRVSAANLPVPATGSAATALAGKVSGVQVLRGSGLPGGGETRVVLRSPTSIRKTVAPLYVVDGVILGSNPADIAALDIESIEVVKGAAAASLYGSRAANGVIQIRTARGNNIEMGKTRITARTEFGQSEVARMLPLNRHHHYNVDPATGQYVDATGKVVPRSLRFAPTVAFADKEFPDTLRDPVGSFFRPGSLVNNTVTLGQNTTATNFFLSFNTTNETGVIREHDGYERFSGKLNLDHRLRSDLQLGVSAYHMRSTRDELATGTFEALVQMAPDVNLLAPNANGQPYIVRPDPLTTQSNPLYLNMTRVEENRRAQTMLGGDLRFSPLDWFSLDGNVSYDRLEADYSFYLPLGTLTATTAPSTGSLTRSRPINDAFNASVGASLQRQFGSLTTRLTGRALVERQTLRGFSTATTNLRLFDVPQLQSGSAPSPRSFDEEIRSNGYFVTLGTDYAGKYILDGLVRRDGSSLFGSEERYNNYYRVSGAYRVAEEPWWPLEQVNEFKLRYSRGTAGNRPSFGDKDALLTLQIDATQPNFGTLNKSTLGNPFLRPEHSTEQEMGIDLVAWNNLSVQVTYASKVSTDQLHAMPVVAAYGYPTQWRNVGTLEGNTWEGSIEAQILDRENFRWRAGLVADRSRFQITDWNAPCVRLGNSFLCEGERMGSIYGIKILNRHDELPALHANSHGAFAVNDDGWLVPVGAGGSLADAKWGTTVSIDGRSYAWGMPLDLMRDDGTAFGAKQIGDGNPDFHVGFTNTLTWRGLTLYTLLDSEIGMDLYNDTRSAMYNPALGVRHGDGDQSGKAPENRKPVSYYSTLYHGFATTSAFIEDGTYLKLREVALRYDVGGAGSRALRHFGVQGANLSLIGRNLLTWTKYTGFDPEVGQQYNGDYSRIDTFGYPNYRTYTAAIELQF
jgi:TonB-linked SusC/RagA family outer membrane protein